VDLAGGFMAEGVNGLLRDKTRKPGNDVTFSAPAFVGNCDCDRHKPCAFIFDLRKRMSCQIRVIERDIRSPSAGG
jgi:hypothetical protein